MPIDLCITFEMNEYDYDIMSALNMICVEIIIEY